MSNTNYQVIKQTINKLSVFQVVNVDTGSIQSVWTNITTARKVAYDLNRKR